MTELKPCPFCGGEKAIRLWRDESENLYTVACDFTKGGCGVSCGYYEHEEEAIQAWNTRAGEEEKTCYVIEEHCNGAHMEDCWIELSCGHHAFGIASDYAYCPGCGAEVVEYESH